MRQSPPIKRAACLMLFCSMCISIGFAQTPALDFTQRAMPTHLVANNSTLMETEPPIMLKPSDILKRFVETEAGFRETMRQYTFRRDVTLQTIGKDGAITGEYIRNSQFVLDDRGGRVERVLYHPRSTIHEMKITKEDIQDLAGAQLFGLELADMSRYEFTYVGQETINSRETHAIDVRLTETPDPHRMRVRFFVGRIWVDALTFQIAKLRGVTVPQGKQRFPVFATSRKLLAESNLLFPSSTIADDILHFPNRDVHYKVIVKYYAYKRFASKVSIVEIDQP